MNCPYCYSKTRVTNSRSHNKSSAVWRRRQCKSCRAIWTTDETYDLSSTHQVQKPSQKRPEPFSRDAILFMTQDSLQHRNDSYQAASALTDTIITKVLTLKTQIIAESQLRTIIYETLHAFDPTAAAVFTAKHRA